MLTAEIKDMTTEDLTNLKAEIQKELDNRKEKKTVTVTIEKQSTSGNRQSWLKLLTGVNESEKGGYAYHGDFLNAGEHELPVGSIIIECNPQGSVKNWWKEGLIYRVKPDGQLELLENGFNWYKEAISFRDAVVSYFKGGE